VLRIDAKRSETANDSENPESGVLTQFDRREGPKGQTGEAA